MSKNRVFAIIGILFLNLMVVYTIGQSMFGRATGYEKYLENARSYAEAGLYSRAAEQYQMALSVKDTIGVRIEQLQTYRSGVENGEFKNAYSVTTTVVEAVSAHNKAPELYELGCDLLYEMEQYQDCAALLMEARDLSVTSDKIQELTEKVRHMYIKTFAMYEAVQPAFDGLMAVYQERQWVYLNTQGNAKLKDGFLQASAFNSGYAVVQSDVGDEEPLWYVIDKNGQRQLYLPKNITASSGVGRAKDEKGRELLLIACEDDSGCWAYYNTQGEKVMGDYQYAGRFRNDVAAVKLAGGQWQLINGQGSLLVEKAFDGVVLNEYDECAPKGLIFVWEGDKCELYNTAGEQLEGFSCQDACPFIDDLAAVCVNGLWGYIDETGAMVIPPQFQEAKSFSNGMAGVYNGEAWYLIDRSGRTVVDVPYEDVGTLTEDGVCFVKEKDYWSYLTFYYTGA